MFEGWHGGHSYFEMFNYDAIGSGEGCALGYGFYFSEHRKGGEYFSEYMNFRNGAGFLYRALLHFTESELLNLDASLSQHSQVIKTKLQSLFGSKPDEPMLHSAYSLLRQKLGDKETTKALLRVGIKAIKSDEGTKPSHGVTFLVLDNAIIKIQEVYRHVPNPYSWERIKPNNTLNRTSGTLCAPSAG